RGVIDPDSTRLGEARRPFPRRAAARGEQSDVEALDRLAAQALNDELLIAEVDLPAHRALRRERHELVGRERALPYHPEHGRPDGARGAHDRDAHQDTTGLWSPRGSSRLIA